MPAWEKRLLRRTTGIPLIMQLIRRLKSEAPPHTDCQVSPGYTALTLTQEVGMCQQLPRHETSSITALISINLLEIFSFGR